VIKFTSSLPRVGGSLRVLRFPPPLKLVTMSDIAEILLKVALNINIYSIRSSVALSNLYLSDIFMYVNSAYFSEICIKYVCSRDIQVKIISFKKMNMPITCSAFKNIFL
jgi:hypothetical protein